MRRTPPRKNLSAALMMSLAALGAMLVVGQLTAGAAGVTLLDEDLELVADLVVTRDGAVIDAVHVVGDIEVRADDVVLRQVRVTSDDPIPIRVDRSARNLVVEDSTVVCEGDDPSYGIGNDHYRAERVELVGCSLGFRDGLGVEVVDSMIDGSPVPAAEVSDGPLGGAEEPTTTEAPEPTEAPVTTAAPTTTEAPVTTAAPTTSEAPTTQAPPTTEAPSPFGVLQWSTSPDRSSPVDLDGSSVPASLYVFLTTDVSGVDHVAWYLNGGLVRDDDLAAPWDMRPAARGESGLVRLDTDTDGHVATAVLNFADGRQETVTARFVTEAAVQGAQDASVGGAEDGATGGAEVSAPRTSFPDAGSTGVQDGVTLRRSGSITVTQDGAVIEGLDVSGRIDVQADDVVIRNVRVRGSAAHLIRNRGRNLLVEHVTLEGQQPCSAGIAFNNYTARHVNVSGCADGLKANGNVVIEDSFIHDLRKWTGTHNDGIQSTGGSDIVIRRNRIEGPWRQSTSAIKLDSHSKHLDGVVVEQNLISGGGYSIYLEAKGDMRTPTNARIVDNVFVTGSMTWNWIRVHDHPSHVISGNVLDDGTPLRP